MPYYTRVLSKDEEFPPLDELAQWVRSEYPEFKLTIEDGEEEEWETLLLSGNDDVEVALLERIPVLDPDELGDFLEELEGLQAGDRCWIGSRTISPR